MKRVASMAELASRARLRKLRLAAHPGDVATPIAAGDALSHLAIVPEGRSRVTLVTPTIAPSAVFAGLRTALEAAGSVARLTGSAVRVLTLDAPRRAEVEAARASVAGMLDLPLSRIEVATAWTASEARATDVWIATYYSTATAVHRAANRGAIDRDRVLYLVQDHEPDFFPASVERAVAAETYHYGFRMLVNSEPLRRFLGQRGVDVARATTFRPALDDSALRRAASARSRSNEVRIGFFARPSKPRNAFETGRAALQIAAQRLHELDVPFRITTMGEQHAPFSVPGGRVHGLGRLGWDESFRALAEVDVLLSLQLTPHPSHPPLDQVVSGGMAVTNAMDETRDGLSARLLTAPATPEALAGQIVSAARRSRIERTAGFDDAFLDSLGAPLSEAVGAALIGIVR